MVEVALAMPSTNPETYTLKRYTPDQRKTWNAFNAASKNGTFLFHRDYLEYHSDRFNDHSLMLYDQKERLLALFPANENGTRLDSHGGLTYGGFITDEQMKTPKMLTAFVSLIDYGKSANFETIRYKTVPHVYHTAPAEEDSYALHLCGAQLSLRKAMSVVDTRNPLKFQTRRRRGVKAAHKASISARLSTDWATYWEILQALLANVHDAEPVHTLDEMLLLRDHFPDNIKLYAAYQDDKLLAGVVIYETQQVARCQYIAASIAGQRASALDLLFDHLLHEVYADKPYIDFGTSEADDDPRYVNTGLIDQKEGFGARAIMHDQYVLTLANANINALIEAAR